MASSSAGLLGGIYSIDFARPLDDVAAPSVAYPATGGSHGAVMAIQVARGWPARARVLAALTGSPEAHLLAPLAHGPALTPAGETGYFIVTLRPPGPSLEAALRPWPEAELLEDVLKPAASVLAALQARGVTHRAIRPGNVFQSNPGTAVTLGAAWAAPPACHQPAWVEPPYAAACLPAGRGNGTIADDVYALGCLLIMLSLGRNPVEGVPDEVLLNQKLDLGSYAAVTGHHRLPASIFELTRGMLADDPDHRPSPALLATPTAARARRIAARPARRAQRGIEIGRQSVATARTLAQALQHDPKAGTAALRTGFVDRWIRRGLGDPLIAGQVEGAVALRDAQAAAGEPLADTMLIANTVAVLDPASPLVWRSMSLWPDGLGAALDHALHFAPHQGAHSGAHLAEIATEGVIEAWASRREGGPEHQGSPLDARDLRAIRKDRRPGTAAWQLCYSLNPLTPCDSPPLQRFWLTRLADLLPVLEQVAAGRPPDAPALVDAHVVAFVAARRDERFHGDLGQLAADLPLDDIIAHVRFVARLQSKLHTAALPNLCAWAVDAVQPLVARFNSRSRRVAMAAELASLAKAGHLPPIVALLDAEEEQRSDRAGFDAAQVRLGEIQHALDDLAAGQRSQVHQVRRLGYDVAGGLGALACLASLAWAVFT